MKHATRFKALARQAGGAARSLAHGAVLSVSLMGMGWLGTQSGAAMDVRYGDVLSQQAVERLEQGHLALRQHGEPGQTARQVLLDRYHAVTLGGTGPVGRPAPLTTPGAAAPDRVQPSRPAT